MATSITPTLSALRELIKKESRIKGSDNLDDFVDGLVNELLCDYVQKSRFFELLNTNVPITTTLNNGTYSLPDDFIVMRMVRYKETASNSNFIRTLNPRPQYIETANGQRPRWYDLAGNSLLIFPFDVVPANDTLLIDYYKFPATLEADDIFPIPRLVAPVKLEAIRRVLLFNQQIQEAQLIKGDSVDIESRSRRPNG